jgi:hypothetical protein
VVIGGPHALAPECELLICCARLDPGPVRSERIRQLLEGPLDADYLLVLAARHGLRPLLYRHLNAVREKSIPQDLHIQLWAAHELRARRNHAMTAELMRISSLFDSSGIPSIPYKGPALAQAVYGDVALREFCDLDILLREQDVLAAKALLIAQGYAPNYALEPTAEASFMSSALQYHLALTHAESDIMVELHWKTDPGCAVELLLGSQLWERPKTASLAGGALRGFAASELLLILCLHGSKHHWASLGWLVDIVELIRQNPAIDWDWITTAASELGAQRRLSIGLYLAHALLAADVPARVLADAGDCGVDKIAMDIAAQLFVPQPSHPGVFVSLKRDLKLYDRPGQQLSHGWNVIFAPSLLELSRPLPRFLSFLYVPARLGRLLLKHRPRLVSGKRR